jgi:iron-sulfur cluster insertion protein
MNIQVSLAPMKPRVAENATLKFSDAAAARVKQLIAEEKNPDLKLRVLVSGGGCSGFQYGFEFDENVKEGDTQINNGGVVLLVDASSMQYLANAEVDFLDGLEGSRFVINNPNAKTTCGCGSSFAI